jgi:hypothetical protein
MLWELSRRRNPDLPFHLRTESNQDDRLRSKYKCPESFNPPLTYTVQSSKPLDPYEDSEHADFLDGVETKPEAASRQEEEMMEAVRYGAYSDAWLVESKLAEKRLVEDRLAIRERRRKEYDIEHVTAVSDPKAAWEEIVVVADERIKHEENWIKDMKSLMAKSIERCAEPDDETLYSRLEELEKFSSEIKRHETDRRLWQSHAERIILLLPQTEQESPLRQVEIVRYRLRICQERAHESRRKLEKTIVEHGISHELITYPYKNLSEDMHIYPRRGCSNYIKALQTAARHHEARERGETISEYEIAENDQAQLEASLWTDSQTEALKSSQPQNNWLLTEIRKRLRPDGKELSFESNVEKYEVIEKEEEDDDDDDVDGEEEAKVGGPEKAQMVYQQMQREPAETTKSKWPFCC